MNHPERQIFTTPLIEEILTKGKICNVAINDAVYPYCIPLNYGYKYEGGKIDLFFHCSKQGKKLKLIDQDANVGFSINYFEEPYDVGQHCLLYYRSIIGQGRATIVKQPAEAVKALELICRHYKKSVIYPLNENYLKNMYIIKLETVAFTAKADRAIE